MAREQITITTRDGACAATVFTPSTGSGPWPAVIYCMDALAIRPAVLEASQRLADAGFVVLTPDLFYRYGPYAPMVPKEVFSKPDIRAELGPYMSTIDGPRAASDATAFLAYIDSRTDVLGKKVGSTGYCMGGGLALSMAGHHPDRFAAAASFHGGNLASDAPTSPHLLASKIKARVYIGVADNDNSYPPEMGERLQTALREGGVEFVSAFYPGALHGWTQTDFPVYDAPAAERHWRDLIGLFNETLR